MKNNLEEVWSQEYRDFMLSFYPESSPLVSTWEIYRMAKVKSQKEIKNLLELTETLNQIRDNLQDENRKLGQELKKTIEQLEKAEKVSEIYLKDRRMLYREMTRLNDLLCNGYIYYDDITEKVINEYIENGKRARQYLQDKDKQGE